MRFLLHLTVTDPNDPEFRAGLEAERAKAAEFLHSGTWEAFYAPEDGSLGFYAVHHADSEDALHADLQILPLIDFLNVTVMTLQVDPLGLHSHAQGA